MIILHKWRLNMTEVKKRCLRTRQNCSDSSESEPEEVTEERSINSIPTSVTGVKVAEAIRELQNARKRRAGLSLSALSRGQAQAEEAVVIASDPFKLKTGGLVSMHSVLTSRTGTKRTEKLEKDGEDEDDVEARLAKTFATETNKRDEDAEMIKYIEEEVARRKGLLDSQPSKEPQEKSDLLRDVPEYLRPAIGKQKEDMLSNQMLCGIPEVDLGVGAKMRNIEATEEAKQDLLKHRFSRRLGGANSAANNVAPTNVAVNFVQHSRWNSHHSADAATSDAAYQRDLLSISTNVEPKKADQTRAETQQQNIEAERQRLRNEKATDSMSWHRFKNYTLANRNRHR